MQDYAKMYYRRHREKASSRTLRQIKRLLRLQLPAEILLFLIVAVVWPAQISQFIRK